MSKYNMLCFGFILGGIVLAIFRAVQSMMSVGEIVWESQTLFSLYEDHLTWMDNISSDFIYNILDKIVNAELFILMIAVGLIMLLIGMFINKSL